MKKQRLSWVFWATVTASAAYLVAAAILQVNV